MTLSRNFSCFTIYFYPMASPATPEIICRRCETDKATRFCEHCTVAICNQCFWSGNAKGPDRAACSTHTRKVHSVAALQAESQALDDEYTEVCARLEAAHKESFVGLREKMARQFKDFEREYKARKRQAFDRIDDVKEYMFRKEDRAHEPLLTTLNLAFQEGARSPIMVHYNTNRGICMSGIDTCMKSIQVINDPKQWTPVDVIDTDLADWMQAFQQIPAKVYPSEAAPTPPADVPEK